jgi:hypothetical protein
MFLAGLFTKGRQTLLFSWVERGSGAFTRDVISQNSSHLIMEEQLCCRSSALSDSNLTSQQCESPRSLSVRWAVWPARPHTARLVLGSQQTATAWTGKRPSAIPLATGHWLAGPRNSLRSPGNAGRCLGLANEHLATVSEQAWRFRLWQRLIPGHVPEISTSAVPAHAPQPRGVSPRLTPGSARARDLP